MTLSSEELEGLQSGVRGDVLVEGQAAFDEARAIWNGMIDRTPAVIVQCQGAADVQRAVDFGRDNNLVISVKGAGHNIAGNAVCDEGLMIDLSKMRSVQVDVDNRRAHVEPGCTLADLDRETQTYGLATPVGINSTTGIAGLTLGGGFGWLSRQHGATVDNLISADVVTADGQLVHASRDSNPDLFWGIRGGGGNFGVVTRFELALHPVGPEILSGLIVFPHSEASGVLKRYREFVTTMPRELNVWVVMRKAPPLPFLPESAHGEDILVLAVFYNGDVSKGQELLAPVRKFGAVLAEHVGPTPYAAWQQAFDPLLTPGARNYWKSHNFTDLPDGLLDTLVDRSSELPTPHSEIFIGVLGGKLGDVPIEETAYADRNANFVMNLHGRWTDPSDDERCITWARNFFDETEEYASGGVYVNFMTADESDRVAAAYGTNYARLVEVKQKFDPHNLFRLNQNIRPDA